MRDIRDICDTRDSKRQMISQMLFVRESCAVQLFPHKRVSFIDFCMVLIQVEKTVIQETVDL